MEKNSDIFNFLNLAETVLRVRGLDKKHHQDEFEKFFSCLIQGVDIIDAYERRDSNISDEEWDLAKYKFFKSLGRNHSGEVV